MIRSTLLTVFLWLQIVILIVGGLATFYWSQDLMLWLIHLVGEERALGAENVVVRPDGAKLLTNPGAMGLWTLPFLILGVVQISAALTLIWLWWIASQAADARCSEDPSTA